MTKIATAFILALTLSMGTPTTPGWSTESATLEMSRATPYTAKAVGRLTCGEGPSTGQSDYVCPAGLRAYHFDDPACPGNPDSFGVYVEYWHTSDNSFDHDVYVGYFTYNCNGVYKPSTVGGNTLYNQCGAESPWGCPFLEYVWTPHP